MSQNKGEGKERAQRPGQLPGCSNDVQPAAGRTQLGAWMLVFVALLLFPLLVPDWREWLLTEEIGNYGIFAVALLGLVLATWRFGFEGRQTSAAERHAQAVRDQVEVAKQHAKVACGQTKTAERQALTADRQAKAATAVAAAAKELADAASKRALIDDRALLHDRYQRAARMLGEKIQAVRIGGVYLLDRLAREQPKDYHLEVMRLFASFVRHQDHQAGDDALALHGRPRADVQAVMDFIGSRGRKQISFERRSCFILDLARANLQCANLQEANLESANLEGARLERANLTGARLKGARVKDTVLAAPGVTAIGLTQAQLDSCAGEAGEGPHGCADLGLEWRPDAAL